MESWHSICFMKGRRVSTAAYGWIIRTAIEIVVSSMSGRSAPMSLLKWAFLFLVLAGIAGLLGFSGIAAGAEDIAKVLFFTFLVIFAVIGILAMTAFKTVT
jgi:uncharacterized membrane protein YtjA (UPF0391 family)